MELMQVPFQQSKPREKQSPSQDRDYITNPDFNGPPSCITEFVDLPDFPRCALGKHVNIGGSIGVVVQIVNQSIKIKTPEGTVQSFNTVRLKRLHSRPLSQETLRIGMADTLPPTPGLPQNFPARVPKLENIPPLDFSREPKPVSEFATRADFPKCVFGEFLDIGGYTGIVIEIIKRSLKVRSRDGATRSYNEEVLRKIYGSRAVSQTRAQS